jgi:hypothetical protein
MDKLNSLPRPSPRMRENDPFFASAVDHMNAQVAAYNVLVELLNAKDDQNATLRAEIATLHAQMSARAA